MWIYGCIIIVLLVMWFALRKSENVSNIDRMILFGSSDCPLCKDLLKDVWPKLIENHPNVKFEYIDCVASKELALQYGIKSFPTIIINGVTTYSGEWTYDALAESIRA